MHNFVAKFGIILEKCKQFAGNQVNEKGPVKVCQNAKANRCQMGRTDIGHAFYPQKRDFLKKSAVFQIIIYNFASEFQNDGLKK